MGLLCAALNIINLADTSKYGVKDYDTFASRELFIVYF